MRTQGFLIRIAICFLLSLIPASELENLIYSQRMEFRETSVKTRTLGRDGKHPEIVIVDAESVDLGNPAIFSDLQKKLLAREPAGLLTPGRYNPNDLIVDSDGSIRSAVVQPQGGRPTLTAMALIQLNVDLHATSPKWDPRKPHLINYVGPAGTIPHCPLSDALSARPGSPCAELKGKIVLLSDDADNGAYNHTPLGEMSRAEILANEIDTVAYHHFIYRATWFEWSLISVAMILLVAFFILYYPVMIGAVAIAGTTFIVMLAGFQLVFHFLNVYIPSANIGGAILITYLVFTGYKLAFQENLQWRALKQAQYLREMDRMKSNVLSLVSHDLKTPLAKIQALVERLKRELALPAEERSDWKELLDSIEASNNELKHYILGILNLSRIESQKVVLNRKTNDINIVIQQVLKRLKPLAQNKNIDIEESLSPLFAIEFDEELMRQVITNLVDNAIKYSPANGKVMVRSMEEEGFVRVEVQDFGPGIPRSQLPMMFRKFSRFLKPLNETVKGTGLGLYLAKYFIELHGGTIGLRSVEGQGSTFSFTLPINSA